MVCYTMNSTYYPTFVHYLRLKIPHRFGDWICFLFMWKWRRTYRSGHIRNCFTVVIYLNMKSEKSREGIEGKRKEVW